MKKTKYVNFSTVHTTVVHSFDFPSDLVLHHSNCTVANCKCEVRGKTYIFKYEYLGLIMDYNLN